MSMWMSIPCTDGIVHLHVHTRTHTPVHTHTHTQTHTHTHTHTHTQYWNNINIVFHIVIKYEFFSQKYEIYNFVVRWWTIGTYTLRGWSISVIYNAAKMTSLWEAIQAKGSSVAHSLYYSKIIRASPPYCIIKYYKILSYRDSYNHYYYNYNWFTIKMFFHIVL